MRNLIALELKRNRLRSYHIAVLICGVTMLGFQYLMAAIPYMDPTEPDAELFSQYPFLMGVTCLVCMATVSYTHLDVYKRQLLVQYISRLSNSKGYTTLAMWKDKIHEIGVSISAIDGLSLIHISMSDFVKFGLLISYLPKAKPRRCPIQRTFSARCV